MSNLFTVGLLWVSWPPKLLTVWDAGGPSLAPISLYCFTRFLGHLSKRSRALILSRSPSSARAGRSKWSGTPIHSRHLDSRYGWSKWSKSCSRSPFSEGVPGGPFPGLLEPLGPVEVSGLGSWLFLAPLVLLGPIEVRGLRLRPVPSFRDSMSGWGRRSWSCSRSPFQGRMSWRTHSWYPRSS